MSYQTTARWDSKKQRAVQRRLYLGRQDPHTQKVIPGRPQGEDVGPGLSLGP